MQCIILSIINNGIGEVTSIKEANIIAHIDLPMDPGKSVAELLAGELDKEGIPLQEGSYISLHGAKLKVYSLTDGKIDLVEISSLKNVSFRNLPICFT